MGTGADGNIIGVADDVDLFVGMLSEDAGDLSEDFFTFGLQFGFAGIEKNTVEDVDGEAALEF